MSLLFCPWVLEGEKCPGAAFNDANTLSSIFGGAQDPAPPLQKGHVELDGSKEGLAELAERRRWAAQAGLLRSEGLRQWLLCLALALSAAIFLWFALAALRTAPRRRLLRAKVQPITGARPSGRRGR